MSRFARIKHWAETSDWKIWLAGGLGIIALVSFIQDAVIEHRVKAAQQNIMAAIDREEHAIRQTREIAEQRDEAVDVAYIDAVATAREVIAAGDEAMRSTQNSMDKGE